MPATAGRVRMPANNRVHSSAALQTHGIWQSAIGYDPYAPDQKGSARPAGGGGDGGGGGGGVDTDNAYDSFQGLLQLAKLTGSNADEARGSCRKCHRIGHLTFQCRNFLTAKEDVSLPADVAAGGLKDLEGMRRRQEKKIFGERQGDPGAGSGKQQQQGNEEEEEDTDVSDSSVETGRGRLLAEAARMRGLLPSRNKKRDGTGHSSGSKHVSGLKDRSRKTKKRRAVKSSSEDSSSGDSSSEERKRRERRRKRKEKERRRSRCHSSSGSSDEEGSSDREKRKRKSDKKLKKSR